MGRVQRTDPLPVGDVAVGEPVPLGADRRVVQHQRFGVRGQAAGRPGGGEDGRGGGVLQHERDALGRIAGVHRQISGARLEHRQQDDDELGRARQGEGHQPFGTGAPGDEQSRQPVGAPVHLVVGEAGVLAGHGGGGRSPHHLGGEEIGQGGLDRGLLRPVPGVEHRMPLGVGQHPQLDQGGARIGHHGGQQPVQMPGHPLDRGRVEQIGVELDGQPQRTVVAGQELQHQIEPRGRARQGVLADPHTPRLLGGHHGALLHHQRLHQRIAAGVAARGQLLDDPLERQPVMAEGVQHRLAHRVQEPLDRAVPVDIGAQHQGVDEESGDRLQLLAVASGGDGAEGDVPLARVAGEQHRDGGREQGEQRGVPLSAEPGQPRHQLGGQLTAVHLARRGAHRRARAVGGQLQRPHPGQPAPPVLQIGVLPGGGGTAALPGREVRVLQGGFGERGVGSGHLGGVERGQFAHQHPDRPAVGDDVMLRQQQDVLLVGEPDQQRPGQRPLSQVVGAVQLAGQGAVERLGALPRRMPAEVDPVQRYGPVRGHPLHPVPVHGGEGGAQGVMAGGEPVQGPAQRGRVQRAVEPQPGPGVVLGAAGGQIVQEPQPPLGGGQRQRTVARRGRDRLLGRTGAAGGPGGQPAGQPRHRPGVEQVAQRELHAQFGPDAGQQPHSEDGVAAQAEEVVLHAHRVHRQHLGPDAGQGLLGGGARGDLAGVAVRRGARGGQRLPVDLAVRGEGKRVQHHIGGRHHMRRQHPGRRGAHLRGLRRGPAAGRHHIGDQPLLAGLVLPYGDHGRAHPGWRANAASTSPSSMRKPRILTWWSARPRNSSSPSVFQRTRSPVRYIREPGGPKGQAVKRSAVSPGRSR
ncbi:hypothetical protein SSPO_092240 [Streptomyces antimycoticus]|uniref:Uncharacterized protein n=1 Tax=Streptomyces antimycoticus TaxID=68175 RepID=A0A499VE89_9ACTN|nr:hypothetical protein SSPO_092240 [Streptomyces antimycoticus]